MGRTCRYSTSTRLAHTRYMITPHIELDHCPTSRTSRPSLLLSQYQNITGSCIRIVATSMLHMIMACIFTPRTGGRPTFTFIYFPDPKVFPFHLRTEETTTRRHRAVYPLSGSIFS